MAPTLVSRFACGAGKAGGVGGSGSITPDAIIPKLKALAKDKNIAGGNLRQPICFADLLHHG
jgi:hypothetical protein